jgi:hypothetical protein
MKTRSKQSSSQQERLIQDIETLEEHRAKREAEVANVQHACQAAPLTPEEIEHLVAISSDWGNTSKRYAHVADVVEKCKTLAQTNGTVSSEGETGYLDHQLEAEFLRKDHSRDENVVVWLHGDPLPHPEVGVDLPTVEMVRPLPNMLPGATDPNGAELSTGTHAATSLSYNPRSPWTRALWQSLVALGKDAGYQDCANWISEHLPKVVLPKYFPQRTDVGLAVRQNQHARDQFQKDLTKVRTKLR